MSSRFSERVEVLRVRCIPGSGPVDLLAAPLPKTNQGLAGFSPHLDSNLAIWTWILPSGQDVTACNSASLCAIAWLNLYILCITPFPCFVNYTYTAFGHAQMPEDTQFKKSYQ